MSDAEMHAAYNLVYADFPMPMEAKAALVNFECYSKPQWLRGNIRFILERLLLSTEDDGLCYQSNQELAERLHLSERTVERAIGVLKTRRIVNHHKLDEAYEVQCPVLQSVLAREMAA